MESLTPSLDTLPEFEGDIEFDGSEHQHNDDGDDEEEIEHEEDDHNEHPDEQENDHHHRNDFVPLDREQRKMQRIASFRLTEGLPENSFERMVQQEVTNAIEPTPLHSLSNNRDIFIAARTKFSIRSQFPR
jgi:ABC-type Zn2+ transport system substrate-binding protein/surface adhesin